MGIVDDRITAESVIAQSIRTAKKLCWTQRALLRKLSKRPTRSLKERKMTTCFACRICTYGKNTRRPIITSRLVSCIPKLWYIKNGHFNFSPPGEAGSAASSDVSGCAKRTTQSNSIDSATCRIFLESKRKVVSRSRSPNTENTMMKD